MPTAASSCAAFVAGASGSFNGVLLGRRPRRATCDCATRGARPPVRRLRMQAPQPEPARESGLGAPTNGFALGDAPLRLFAELGVRPERFAKPGAYAVRDAGGTLCYVGYSKNIAAKLKFHSGLVPDRCASFQVYIPPVPPEMISPEMLEGVLEYWVQENGGVPHGNTSDRELWEVEPLSRKSSQEQYQQRPVTGDIPVRERTTPRRAARARPVERDEPWNDRGEARAEASRARRRANSSGWDASGDDYVDVDVDPLDPFTATKHRRSTRSQWDSVDMEEDEVDEDWIPILALVGVGGFIWMCGMLGNVIPAATPSLGM